jgi:plastocyanin
VNDDVPSTRIVLTGCAAAVLIAGCSGGGSANVLGKDTPPPALMTSAAPAANATPTRSAAAPSGSDAIGGGGYYGYGSAPRTTTSPSAAAPVRRTTPKPAAAQVTGSARPATPAAAKSPDACGAGGSTTTIEATAPDRFAPSAVAIRRCDSVRVVYADPTGVPHNWQGPGWASPDLRTQGQSYTYRFTSTGSFDFFCSYHRAAGMTGRVTVS